ncbi:MAG: hypothetical protein MZV65_34725 [Chromatiales bacterium]|nr:hypothetical protein [Chromatiales bacterium]
MSPTLPPPACSCRGRRCASRGGMRRCGARFDRRCASDTLVLEKRRLGAHVGHLEHELQLVRERGAGGRDRPHPGAGADCRLFFAPPTRRAIEAMPLIVKLCANLVGLRDPSLASLARTVAEHAHAAGAATRYGRRRRAGRDLCRIAPSHRQARAAGQPAQQAIRSVESGRAGREPAAIR